MERLAATAKVGLTVDWGEIERAGVDYSQPMGLSVSEMTAAEALDRMARVGSEGEPLLDWRARDSGLEFGSKHELDKREVELVTYNIADTLAHIANGFAKSREDAAEQVGSLITSLADPENWRENGGDLAQLHMVGGRLFVQAPARMQTKVAWILAQLPKAEDEAPRAAIERAGVPVLKDLPLLNHLFSVPDDNLGTLEEQYNTAKSELELIGITYRPSSRAYTHAEKNLQDAEDALRAARQTAAASDPQVIRQRYEQAKNSVHFARQQYTVDSPEYKAAEAQLRAMEQSLTQVMHASLLLEAGDTLHLEIFELERAGEWFRTARQIEADGVVRFALVGEFKAAGRAAREVEADVLLAVKGMLANPQVSVYQFDAAILRGMNEAHQAGSPDPQE